MSFAENLRAEIAARGGITVEEYMARCNAHYYATRDPFGAAGDFTTAPEVSQVFGECIASCLADWWGRAGRPVPVTLAEAGPGRGTLMADMLRTIAKIAPDLRQAVRVVLIETSPALKERQTAVLGGVAPAWVGTLDALPRDGVLLFVANEFLDALPAKQFVGHHGVWHERWIVWRDGALAFERGPRANDAPAIAAREGDIAETSPAMREAVFSVARHIADHDGLALFIDYGHAERGIGDTMQAVKRHAYANPLEAPGGQDLTIHVDFEAMSVPAVAADAYVHGPVTQAAFLNALGARERTAQLARAKPEKAEDLMLAYERLTGRLAMGELFKVMALTGPGGPVPAGMGA